jgi:hypothetical protein
LGTGKVVPVPRYVQLELNHWIVLPFDPGVPDSVAVVPEHTLWLPTLGAPGSGFTEITALPIIIAEQPETIARIVYVAEVVIPVKLRLPPSVEF